MKTYVLLSATGEDRPGILNAITSKVKGHGANIESQRNASMAGQFTLLLLISVEDDQHVDALIDALNGLVDNSFKVFARRALSVDSSENSVFCELMLKGKDQVGIVDKLTLLLLENNVNLTDMKQDVSADEVPSISLKADLSVPRTVEVESLHTKLKSLKEDFDVDVELKRCKKI